MQSPHVYSDDNKDIKQSVLDVEKQVRNQRRNDENSGPFFRPSELSDYTCNNDLHLDGPVLGIEHGTAK
jgi:hypothetical protein